MTNPDVEDTPSTNGFTGTVPLIGSDLTTNSFQNLDALSLLASDCAQAISTRVGRRIAELSVTSESGGIVIVGRTNCYFVRQLALAAVSFVPANVLVIDRIKVGGSGTDH